MKYTEKGVLLTHEEYNKYLRMEACINELKNLKTNSNEEVEA